MADVLDACCEVSNSPGEKSKTVCRTRCLIKSICFSMLPFLFLLVPHVYGTTEADRKLLSAARSGDLTGVKECLGAGANVNARDDKGETPLTLAASGGHTSLAKVLLDKGADVNAQSAAGVTALMHAVFRNYTDLLNLLLQKGATVDLRQPQGGTALILAATAGHTDVIKILLNKGANINAKTITGVTPLMAAVNHGKLETAKALLEKGADPNVKTSEMQTPLILAARRGISELVKVLIVSGTDVDAKDKEGKSALNWAISGNKNDIIVPLLNATRQLDEGAAYGLLMKSIDLGEIEIIKSVTKKEFQIKKEYKNSCLEKAVDRGAPETVILLLSKWSDSDSVVHGLKVCVFKRKHDTFKKICASGLGIQASATYDLLALIAGSDQKSNYRMFAEMAEDMLSHYKIDFNNPNMEKIIVAAVDRANAPLVELLLKKGANPGSKDRYGNPLLFVATCGQSPENVNVEIVKSLLQKGASDCLHPLLCAVAKCRSDVAGVFLERRPNLDVTTTRYTSPERTTLRKELTNLVKDTSRRKCYEDMIRLFRVYGIDAN